MSRKDITFKKAHKENEALKATTSVNQGEKHLLKREAIS